MFRVTSILCDMLFRREYNPLMTDRKTLVKDETTGCNTRKDRRLKLVNYNHLILTFSSPPSS